MKKWIILALLCALAAVIFFVCVLSMFMAAFTAFEKRKAGDMMAAGGIVIPITFTGTVSETAITLHITGEGIDIPNISGTVDTDGNFSAGAVSEGGVTTALTGNTEDGKITFSGDSGGIPVSGEGTVTDGVISGSGFYGKAEDGLLMFPFPAYISVTSEYGERIDPISHKPAFHYGIDLAGNKGGAILAAGSGTVIYAGPTSSYGNYIQIDHGDDLVTCYGHNSQIFVETGDVVTAGQQIAGCGNTGKATGYHLHFEVKKYGIFQNPRPWIFGGQ
jgi:hypothetical protein